MSEYPATDAINEAVREAMDPTYSDFVNVLDDLINAIWQVQSDLDAGLTFLAARPSIGKNVAIAIDEAEHYAKKLDEMLYERLGRNE